MKHFCDLKKKRLKATLMNPYVDSDTHLVSSQGMLYFLGHVLVRFVTELLCYKSVIHFDLRDDLLDLSGYLYIGGSVNLCENYDVTVENYLDNNIFKRAKTKDVCDSRCE